jgi:hypothetical protein
VHDIPDAPTGAYWDGGITDYHLHLNYKGLVLYPHFQQAVVPGWLDKALKWRHKVKLPDRSDFVSYASDFEGRVKVWRQAVSASEQLAQEFADWVANPNMADVHRL